MAGEDVLALEPKEGHNFVYEREEYDALTLQFEKM